MSQTIQMYMKFNGGAIPLLEVEGRKAMTAEAVGMGLAYDDSRVAVMNLYNRHRDEFAQEFDYSVIKLMTEAEHPAATGGELWRALGSPRKPTESTCRRWLKTYKDGNVKRYAAELNEREWQL